jgi:hypothetical protein
MSVYLIHWGKAYVNILLALFHKIIAVKILLLYENKVCAHVSNHLNVMWLWHININPFVYFDGKVKKAMDKLVIFIIESGYKFEKVT